MKLLTNRLISFSFGLILSLSICTMSSRSGASEPDYDELFSYRYAASGFELSEDGVRQALEQFDHLGLDHKLATIAVVGEQNYQSLTPYLKDIYNRRPEDAPNSAVAFNYRNTRILNRYRTTVARALVRCGDPDGERYAIEQALNSPNMGNMGRVPAKYSIRTLKYIVHHFGTDVSAELEFLIETNSDVELPFLAFSAVRELVEIKRYLQLKSDPQESIYSAAIERQKQNGDSRLRRTFDMVADLARPSWLVSIQLINAQKSNQSGR